MFLLKKLLILCIAPCKNMDPRVKLCDLFDSEEAQRAFVIGLLLAGQNAKSISDHIKISTQTIAKWRKLFYTGAKLESSHARRTKLENQEEENPNRVAERQDAVSRIGIIYQPLGEE
eukprot:NODE_283_length_10814_cov_0.705460.p14 type:complete len:117 gc:universal NODE_283_length_10814_cov_0.705460:5210-4860(-)